ncbi:MAG: Macrolide export protein MacA [Gemmatimonadaceae bacterium]|nr:Macrolide export protein MacA [Gemmatimonadaceae bacterium]
MLATVRRLHRLAPAAFLSVLAACANSSADARAETAPATASIGPENAVTIQTAELWSGPSISGTLTPEREATARAQLSGSLLAVLVDQGVRVRAGQVLVRIDDRTVRDTWLSAKSAHTTAENSAQMVERELQRAERLSQSGAIADRDLEQARWNNTAAQSQLADARARLTLAQKQLDDAQVRAPFDGIVSARMVSTGDIVQPGGALLTIVDPSSMRLEASIPASDLTMVKLGAPVTFTVSGYPGRGFAGKVTRMNPTADVSTGQVRITVSIPNVRSDLVGGLFAQGRVGTARRQGLVAPVTAVDLRGIKPNVLRLKDGRVERVEVEIGIKDEETERVEILSGVVEGDTLLVGAAQGLTPGTLVKVMTASDRPVTRN